MFGVAIGFRGRGVGACVVIACVDCTTGGAVAGGAAGGTAGGGGRDGGRWHGGLLPSGGTDSRPPAIAVGLLGRVSARNECPSSGARVGHGLAVVDAVGPDAAGHHHPQRGVSSDLVGVRFLVTLCGSGLVLVVALLPDELGTPRGSGSRVGRDLRIGVAGLSSGPLVVKCAPVDWRGLSWLSSRCGH